MPGDSEQPAGAALDLAAHAAHLGAAEACAAVLEQLSGDISFRVWAITRVTRATCGVVGEQREVLVVAPEEGSKIRTAKIVQVRAAEARWRSQRNRTRVRGHGRRPFRGLPGCGVEEVEPTGFLISYTQSRTPGRIALSALWTVGGSGASWARTARRGLGRWRAARTGCSSSPGADL